MAVVACACPSAACGASFGSHVYSARGGKCGFGEMLVGDFGWARQWHFRAIGTLTGEPECFDDLDIDHKLLIWCHLTKNIATMLQRTMADCAATGKVLVSAPLGSTQCGS